jgi:hypothetical protein
MEFKMSIRHPGSTVLTASPPSLGNGFFEEGSLWSGGGTVSQAIDECQSDPGSDQV